MANCFLDKQFIYQNMTMKALYSHKHQQIKTFLSENDAFDACLHFPVTEMGEPLRNQHSYWLMFESKKGFSHRPIRMLVLWDFPTSVTGK